MESWKVDALNKLRIRNSTQTLPVQNIYKDHARLLSSYMTLLSKQVEFGNQLMLIRKEIQEYSGTEDKIPLLQNKLRVFNDMMRTDMTLDASLSFHIFWKKFQDLHRMLQSLRDEKSLVQSEMAASIEKNAHLESEICRLKADMELICVENVKLRALLRENNLFLDFPQR